MQMRNKPSDYKVVRTSSPPRYFQSYTDACDDAARGLEDTEIIPLYTSNDVSNENLIKEIEQLNLLVKLLREHPDRVDEATYAANEARCAHYGCDNENQLQWKWRNVETLPQEFDYEECETALLDAFIRQGGARVWAGDGSSCATQIVEAVWKRMKIAEDKVKELQAKKEEPTTPRDIQARINDLQNEIMSLTYKIVGDPNQSVLIGPQGVIFNPFSTKSHNEDQ
jgi:hypothetical protein